MRFFTGALMTRLPLSAWETVLGDTPVARATSMIVVVFFFIFPLPDRNFRNRSIHA